MDKILKFILNEFLSIFLTLFLIISLIISLIFIVSLSNVTSSLNITFLELLKMYMLSLPQIIFITLSVSFFISANSLYSKISETQELVAFLSLGINPLKILKPIIIMAILVTFLNMLILFISIPYSKVAYYNFKNEKKQEAKFNFRSGEISQKFGKWLVFANENNKNFNNIYLYSPDEKKFIIAKKAKMFSHNGILHFSLSQGKIYDFNNSYKIVFSKMKINKKLPHINFSIFNFHNYLKYNKKIFVKYIPFMFLPIALLFFIPIISFLHPRLHKNRYLIYSIGLLGLYIGISFANKNLILAFFIPLVFFIIGGMFYKCKNF